MQYAEDNPMKMTAIVILGVVEGSSFRCQRFFFSPHCGFDILALLTRLMYLER
jgi:hypothetical protein